MFNLAKTRFFNHFWSNQRFDLAKSGFFINLWPN